MLLYPTYFSPIIHYAALAQTETVTFEIEDNYQKQTYRTRCYIYGPNGKQLLSIPVKNANSKQKTKDVLIDASYHWQKQHLKAVEAAYRSSPFYEYYENEIRAIFDSKPKFLLDFNLKCQEVMLALLQLELSYTKTQRYEQQVDGMTDARSLADAKRTAEFHFEPYTQVFAEKHGFLTNLSILDLLFNEGTNALPYLERQQIDLP